MMYICKTNSVNALLAPLRGYHSERAVCQEAEAINKKLYVKCENKNDY